MDKFKRGSLNPFKEKLGKDILKKKIQMNNDGLFYISSGVGTVVGEELFIHTI